MDEHVSQLVELAIADDVGSGDLTSEYFVPEGKLARGFMTAKADGVLSGVVIAAEVFRRIDPEIEVEVLLGDGSHVVPGAIVMNLFGKARSILTAERVALNFVQHLSGVATMTNQFVEAVQGTKAVILDTRKTTPGWRFPEKAAVVAGGGCNHRMGLYDRVMVKDNHLVAEGGIPMIAEGIERLKKERPDVEVEVEADSLEQVEAFFALPGVDYVLLDNMSNDELRRAVEMRPAGGPSLEASGGVNLDTVAGIAATGVDFISVGAVTHSAPALDISLDFVPVDDGR